MVDIVIADDNKLMRETVRMLLDSVHDMRVVAEAEDGNEALALAKELQPDVVVLDIGMPGPNGIEVTQRLHAEASDVAVVILTLYHSGAVARLALAEGARAYVSKRTAGSDLIPAIRAVLAGQTFLSAGLGSPA